MNVCSHNKTHTRTSVHVKGAVHPQMKTVIIHTATRWRRVRSCTFLELQNKTASQREVAGDQTPPVFHQRAGEEMMTAFTFPGWTVPLNKCNCGQKNVDTRTWHPCEVRCRPSTWFWPRCLFHFSYFNIKQNSVTVLVQESSRRLL